MTPETMLDGYEQYLPGVWRQSRVFAGVQTYNPEYVSQRYDVYDTTRRMSVLRLRKLRQVAMENGVHVVSVLDFGYGNGDFLAVARHSGVKDCAGMDVSGYPLPEGCRQVQAQAHEALMPQVGPGWSALTFFDSLEHVIDAPAAARDLIASAPLAPRLVMMSVPWLHPERGSGWFEQWKHRRPDEHFWHFSASGLVAFWRQLGYRPVYLGNLEDEIRQPAQGEGPNILTGIFMPQ